MDGHRGRLAALYMYIVMFSRPLPLLNGEQLLENDELHATLTGSCRLYISSIFVGPIPPLCQNPASLSTLHFSHVPGRTDCTLARARLGSPDRGREPNVDNDSIEEIKGIWRGIQ
jgi:hypothetical protein